MAEQHSGPVKVATTAVRGGSSTAGTDDGERYELIERLGEGGMGVVWRARDRVLDRDVALKVLHERYRGADAEARVAAEARAMARLAHPNVVAVYDVGHREGRTFLTMELVDGVPLSRWLETPRSWREVVEVFRAAGAGVAAAHAAGVIHRDLKPGNILVGNDGRVRVADFGVADAGAGAGDGGGSPGTPAYMAPERLEGGPADARSDQFAFAVSLYQALHGRLPWDADSATARLWAMREPARPVRDVPAWLTAVVDVGLARDPERRYPSMAALVAALDRPRRRRRGLAVGAVAAIGFAVVIAMTSGRKAAPCAGIERRLDGVWDPTISRGIASAAIAASIPEAAATAAVLDRELGRYASRWVAARQDACRATRIAGSGDETALARRNACLDLRLRAFQLVVGKLAAPDRATFATVVGAVASLPAVDDCDGTAAPAAPATAGAREDLAVAISHFAAGKLPDAAAVAGRAAAAARAAGDRALELEALIVIGRSITNDQPAVATTVQAAAVSLAALLGAPGPEIDARVYLAAAQIRLPSFAAATANLDAAEALLAAHPDRMREARLALARGGLLGQQSKFAESVVQNHRALAINAELYGDDSVVLIRLHRNLAMDYQKLGKLAEAEAQAQRLLALTSPLGDGHREVARAHQVLASILEARGQGAAAQVELERSIEALHSSVGEGTDLAASITNLGNSLYLRGDRAGALVRYREALAMGERIGEPARTRLHTRHNIALVLIDEDPAAAEAELRAILAEELPAFGPDHVDVGRTHQVIGRALAGQGKAAAALTELTTAQRILEARFGRDHVEVAETLSDQAMVHRRAGRFAVALPLAREAKRIRDAVIPDGHRDRLWSRVDIAHDQLALGDAAGREVAAVVPLAEAAHFADVAAVARWLLARDAERRGDRAQAATLAAAIAPVCADGAPSTDVRWRKVAVCADAARWRGAP
jgi:tetratricopeptide (TPR) repeat protein/predicted Ser/Thr protein kinase